MVGGACAVKKSDSDMHVAIARPNRHMYVAIATAMVGAIMFGIDTANFGAVQGFGSFQQEWCVGNYGDAAACGPGKDGAAANVRWQQDFVSIAALLVWVGAAVGAMALGPVVANNMGRRLCISSGAAVVVLGCLLTSLLAFASVPVFFVGRFVTGFGIGLCCYALPMYNSEVSAPSVRGTTGSLFQIFVVLGGLIASIVTEFCREWNVGMLLPAFAGVFVMVSVWFTPESPRYVMAKHGYTKGEEVLQAVRTGDVSAEAREMNEQIAAEVSAGQVSYGQIFSEPSLRKRVLISCWLQVAQQFTGMNTIIMFSSTLFTEMGFKDPFAVNLAFNALMMFGMIAGLLLLDSARGGRRVQLLVVTAVIAPLLLLAALAGYLSWPATIGLVIVCLFAFTWQLAWGMIPWIYPSELFSMAERERAVGFAVFTQYFANAVLLYVVPVLNHALGVNGMFLFFGLFNILNFAFVWLCIKETKGLALEDIPSLFGAQPCREVCKA